jgi:hypothetical protein
MSDPDLLCTDLLYQAMAMAALLAMVVLAAAAAIILLLVRQTWCPPGIAPASVLALGVGFYLGCGVLGVWPRWPAPEDTHRFLTLVLPAALAVELLAAFSFVPRWLVWLLRLGVAASAARILLHATTYVEDLAGPDSREWSPAQAWLILTGLAAALGAEWVVLAVLLRRAPGPAVPAALAITCAGAGVTLMLSGYLTAGPPGLVLAAALAGTTAVMLVLPGPPRWSGVLGVGLVGLFSLVVMGRFFGKLTTLHALLLFAAPLLCWLPELPGLVRMRPWLRGLTRLVLVAVLVLVILVQAYEQFLEDSRAPSGPPESSLQDSMDFGR